MENSIFGKDKLWHFINGAIIFIAVMIVWHIWKGTGNPQPTIGIFASGLAGVAKETWDKHGKGREVDPADIWFTILGGIIGAAIYLPIYNAIF